MDVVIWIMVEVFVLVGWAGFVSLECFVGDLMDVFCR